MKYIIIMVVIFLMNNVGLFAKFNNWYKVSSQISNEFLNSVDIIGDSLLIAVGNLGVIKIGNLTNEQWFTARGSAFYEDLLSVKSTAYGVFACGNNGTLINSPNLGNNWITIDLKANNDLHSIDFKNEFGIICGSNGSIFITSDGGYNWNSSGIQLNNNLNCVRIISDSEAIVIGDSGFIATYFYRTNKIKVSKQIVFSDLKSLSLMVDGSLLIGGENGILMTADSGLQNLIKIITINPPDEFVSLFALNDSIIIAGTIYSGFETQSVSKDFGVNWTHSLYSSIANKSIITNKNKDTAYLCGYQGQVVSVDLLNIKFKNFKQFDNIIEIGPEPYSFKKLYIPQPHLIYTIQTGESKQILQSSDSGYTFKKIGNIPGYGANDFYIFDEKNFLILFDKVDLITIDGVTRAVYEHQIGNSTDGGISWNIRSIDTSFSPIKGFASKNDDLILFYSRDSYFFYSTDKGLNWIKSLIPDNMVISSLDIVRNGLVYLSAFKNSDDHFLLSSNDLFSNWKINNLPSFGQFKIVLKFFNDDIGYILVPNRLSSRNNIIYKTEDRGANWKKVLDEFYPIENICDIGFINDNTIYVVQGCGKLLISTNNGESWENSIFKKYLIDDGNNTIHIPDINIGYINDGAYIYRSVDSQVSINNADKPNEEMIISPNPASDYIDIDLERWSPSSVWTPSEIQIYNSLGQCVLLDVPHFESVGHLYRIDISGLSPGMYYAVLRDGKDILTNGFIVLR